MHSANPDKDVCVTSKPGALLYLAWAALGIPVMLYRLVMRLRNLCYDAGILKTHRVKAPVVSIGNISVGGTGKTPMAVWTAKQMLAAGWRPAILSRGYAKQKYGGIDDENECLRRELKDVPVIPGGDRVRSAREALETRAADSFILDDGFQHRRLGRDLDIVMLDATEDGMRLMLRREGRNALGRASAIVVSHSDECADPDSVISGLEQRFPGKTVCAVAYEVTSVLHAADDSPVNENELKGARFGAFCGIGKPGGFRQTLRGLTGKYPELFLTFPDHYRYLRADLERIIREAGRAGLDVLYTTAKDAVKLKSLSPGPTGVRIAYVQVEPKFMCGEAELRQMINELPHRGVSAV